MRIIKTGSASALLLAAHACASAQATPPAIQQVIISTGAAEQRRQSTTTTIIVGRDEILRQGDATLADVLKRQPGITLDASPGKAPAIRMRGMGAGYVSILLNGLPAPGGFSLESISPDLIERIEIQRAATAETSSQAVAGTINVILRRAGPTKGGSANEVKAGSAVQGAYLAPQLVAQHSGRAGTLAYTLSLTARRQQNPIRAIVTEQGSQPALARSNAFADHQLEDVLELAPRLSWQPDAADSISAQAYLRKRHIHNAKHEREITSIGAPTAFPHADQTYESHGTYVYADAVWTRKLDAGARLSAKLSAFSSQRDADFVYLGMNRRDQLLETHQVASGPTEREWTFNGSWRRPVGGGHALAAGWELGRKRRSEYRRERQYDAGGTELLASDEDYRAQVARSALFIQDEWDITSAWSAYIGLRREHLHTIGEGNADQPVDVDAGAWSPIFQTLFKPVRQEDESGPRDQFRLAVSRTYKAPNIVQLMPRRYTVDNNNSPTNPDQQGNPRLRPELSSNVDLSWERYIGKNDMLSVSAFYKRIRDITLDRTEHIGQVWTVTPDNQGGATVRGIEFEGKAVRGALSARVNLIRNWSRLDSVPGPDNRIDGQPAWSGNAGLDYLPASRPMELGATYSYRGRVASRASVVIFSDDDARRQLDLYALYKRDAKSRLRLSVSDLLHQDYRERLAYQGAGALARTTRYRTRATWRLVLEQAW